MWYYLLKHDLVDKNTHIYGYSMVQPPTHRSTQRNKQTNTHTDRQTQARRQAEPNPPKP
jgi:hypothetical protein